MIVPDEDGDKDPRLTSENNDKVEGTKNSKSIMDVCISDHLKKASEGPGFVNWEISPFGPAN